MGYTRTLSALAMSTVSLLALSAASPAVAGGALPSGGQVIAGQAAIAAAPGGVTINQSSGHAIINWQNFSVGAGNKVQFNNGSGATLNRVTGSSISQINGVLSATGSVYLINPQGVVVGPGGKVITGGSFVASTRDVDNDSFMNGDPLHAKGSSSGSVINQGAISSAYGDTILIGQSVSNSGRISAKKGTVALVAGDDVTLRPLSGDARISVSAGKGDVTNTGTIAAAQAELNAAGGNVYAVAGGGGISATGTRTINGHVWLTAGGDTDLSGDVTANSKSGDGGTVTVRAQNIVASGSINASATKADAAGGTVSIIAAGTTTLKSAITATGGQGGTGGYVETSGAHLHVADGATVATNAADGSNGTWLIDPNDYTIAASGGDISGATLSSNLATTDVTIATATDGTAGGNGDIFVNDAVSWTSSHVLTLNADRNITVNAGISLAAGSLVLNASAGALTINNIISVTGAGAVSLTTAVDTTTYGPNYPLANLSFGTGGSVDFGSTNHNATLSINGASYTLLYSLSDFNNGVLSSPVGDAALATSLSGGSYNAYISMEGGTLEGLGHVLNGVTFNPNGNSAGLVSNGYGTIRDIGVTNATVNGGSLDDGGLAGQLTGAIVNSYFTGTLLEPSGGYVGGLVGYLSSGGSYILNSWTNATVSAGIGGGVGGLVGYAAGNGTPSVIQNSYALGSVTGGRAVGGAVGILGNGSLINVHASGNVTDTSTSSSSAAYAGGLVGESDNGAITNTYATGNVSGGYNSGGLVGYAQSAISLSYATGDVLGGGASNSSVGGLIGSTSGLFAIDQVAAYGSVSGGYYAGGLIGDKHGGIALSNAFSAGSVTGTYAVGGLIGGDDAGGIGGQSLSTSLAIGAVIGGTNRGGAVGYTQNETFTDVYFTSDTTGTTATVGNYSGFTGITALTTATAQNGSLPGNLSSSIWGSQSGVFPYLKTFFPSGVQVLGGTAVNANGASIAVADNGYRQGKGSVGANGVFYIAMQPGSVTTGDTIVLYNSMVNPGGIITTAPASLTNLSYTGGILVASTSATSATAADAGITAQVATILSHDPIGAAVLASVTDHGYIASGAGFDLNESFTGPVYAQTTTAAAPLTVSGTITATGAVTLSTSGTLTINAPITASGKVVVALTTGTDAYSQADLVFGTAGKLDFGATNQSSTLSVDSVNYSLLYSMANLVSTAGNGTFALATALTAGSYTDSVLATLNSGALFEGLGNTITGLTITNMAVSASGGLGLIGNNNGTIRDVRLAGLNITGGGSSAHIGGLVGVNTHLIVNSSSAGLVKGDDGSTTGGLVGYNTNATARIVNSSSSATVTLPATDGGYSSSAGGLLGENIFDGVVTGSWATGNVTGQATAGSSAGGLVGFNSGTISNAYATGNVSAGGNVGGLAASSQTDAVTNVHATGTVTGLGSATNVGGLFGANSSTITNAYATGNVTGAANTYSQNTGGLIGYNSGALTGVYATGNVTNGGDIGGLVGYNNSGVSIITNAYATGSVTVVGGSTSINSVGGLIGLNTGGSVSLAFATGNASADAAYSVGGLIGQSYEAVTNTYATGSVTNGASSAGGLIGYMASSITSSYATGRVSGTYMGGLTGTSGASIVNSYFDSQTTGQAHPSSFTSLTTGALTTAAFQNGSLPSGFDSSVWSTGAGLYPYITSFFPGGVQAVSGTVTGAGSSAGLYVGGTAVGSASVGANGYYYFAVPNGVISGAGSVSLITLDTSGALLTTLTGQTTGLNLASGGLYYTTGGTSLAATYAPDRATLLGYASTPAFVAGLDTQLTVTTSASFIFDTPLTLSGGLTVTAPNSAYIGVTHSITAGGPVTVTTLSVMQVGDAITAPTILLRGGIFQLDSDAAITTTQTGDSLQLVADTTFFDLSGGGVLSSAGRWLIFSPSPGADTFSRTDSGNTAVWNAHYGDTISQSGNRYVFSTQPTATVSIGTPATKTYGDSISFDGSYLTATGLDAGVAGIYLADTATSIFATLPTFTSAGAAVTANVGSYGVTLSGGTAANGYAITLSNVTPGTLTVNQRNLTVTGDTYTRTYGDANAATITAAGDNLVNGDTLSAVDITNPTASATSDVGTYAYTAGNAAFSSGTAGNYNITYADSALNVTARPITVTADAQTRNYGDANPALTFTSSSLGAGTAIAGALTVGADATTDVGSYAIGQGTVDNTHNTNYDISFVSADLDITARPVTVTANAQTRYYGDANPAFTFTNTSLGAGVALSGALDTLADATSAVGSYGITAGTLTMANNSNYTISYVGANLGVTARPITVTGDLISRQYGDDTAATGTGSVTLGNLVNGDTISTIDVLSPTASASSDVGTYAYTPGNAAFSAGTASNYNISYAAGTLNVTARPVTVTADAQTRNYGDTNPALTFTSSSLGAGTAITGALTVGADATTDVGSYAIGQGTVDNTHNTNYDITYSAANLDITARPITVTADSQTMIYGDSLPALTYSNSSLGAGAALTGGLDVPADPTSNVGSYALTIGSLATSNTNYAISFVSADLDITARPVTVTANAQTRYYGDANPAFTFTNTSLGAGVALSGALDTAADATSAVGSYGITAGTLTMANNSNYTISYIGANLGVTARPITVTGDLISRQYGDDTAATGTGSVTLGNLVNGDTISTIDVLSPTASATSDVGTYAYTPGNAAFSAGAASNYNITYADGALNVTARPVTVTADALTRHYGDTNPALTFTNSSLGAGAALQGLLTTLASATSDVGSYAIGQGTVDNTHNTNYDITYSAANLGVTARPITVIGDPVTRDYGDANPATTTGTVTFGGNLVNGDALATIDVLSSTASASSDVGNYTYIGGNAAFSAGRASNYAITYFGGALTVNPRAVTVTATPQTRIYGDANPALTFTSTSLGAGAALQGSLTTLASATSDVGSYAITQGMLTTANNSNYVVSYSGDNLGVTARPITLTGDLISRLYGDANPTASTGSVSLGSLVNGDTVSGVDVLSATADGSSAVGNGYSYAIGNAAFSAGNASNYTVSYVDGGLHVTARPITVTGDLITRIYGDANPVGATGTVSLGNLVNGDAISGVGVASSTATASSDVGNGYSYAANSAVFSSGAAGNYAITYVDGALHVTARAVTVAADTLGKSYGDANPALTFTSTSLGAGAALQGALTTLATASSDVGSYAISQGTLTTANNSNYTVSYAGANLGIAPRAVTVTADAQSRIYGDANPALTFTSTSLGAGTALAGVLTTLAGGASGVGGYAITAGTVTTADNPNYVVSYVGANLDVTARPLTVTADAISRLYGDANPALTQTVSGLVNGDAVTGALATTADATSHVGSYTIGQGTLAASTNYAIAFTPGTLSVNARPVTVAADAASRFYGDANPALTFTTSSLGAGAALTGSLATAATATSDAGSYAITGGSLLGANSDYVITYNGAALTVAARPVTVTADGASRIYGDANPALTFTSSSLGAGAALQGALTTLADGTSGIGNYAITQGSLTGANNPNYAITYAGANLAVTPRALTVTADDLSRLYGAANPALTQTVSGLVNGDTVTGTAATSAGTTSNVGSYAITLGSLTAGTNYTVSFTAGTLTVTPALLTVTAADAGKIYGDSASLTGFTASGLLNSDSISGLVLTSTGAGVGANVGSYAIQAANAAGSGLGNYTIAYQQGTLSVTPRALTVTADDLSRLYGAANPALTQTVSGLVNGDTVTGTAATSDGTTSNVGSYAITLGSLTAGANYTVTFVPGSLTITPAPLTVTADDISAQTVALANPTATLKGLVAGDTSAVVTGLQFTLVPVDGSATAYTVVPSNAQARNYTIGYVNGQLTVVPADPTTDFIAPIIVTGALPPMISVVTGTPPASHVTMPDQSGAGTGSGAGDDGNGDGGDGDGNKKQARATAGGFIRASLR